MSAYDIFLAVLGGLCLFGLGVCIGNLMELSKEIRQLDQQRYENERDLNKLEKMEKEHIESMKDLNEVKEKYEKAYEEAVSIVDEWVEGREE